MRVKEHLLNLLLVFFAVLAGIKGTTGDWIAVAVVALLIVFFYGPSVLMAWLRWRISASEKREARLREQLREL